MVEATALHGAITGPQRKVLGAIADFHHTHGYAPTLRDIREALGYSNQSSVHEHLVTLRSLGLVWWMAGQARTLILTDAGRDAL